MSTVNVDPDELPAATRAELRTADEAADGRVPFVKLDADGIHIMTPLGRLDAHNRTDHVITRDRARAMARTLLWVADATVEVLGVADAAGRPVAGTRTLTEATGDDAELVRLREVAHAQHAELLELRAFKRRSEGSTW